MMQFAATVRMGLEQTALKCLYLTIRSLDPSGRGRQRRRNRWKPALNAFAVTFQGRIEITDQQSRQQDLHRRSDRPGAGVRVGG
jgi:hypothetical protein